MDQGAGSGGGEKWTEAGRTHSEGVKRELTAVETDFLPNGTVCKGR